MTAVVGNSEGPSASHSRFSKWTSTLLLPFKDEERRLILKLDIYLLCWAFIAGLTKDMDQSSTTQAYVSGMKEALELNGNQLVEFTTYFSIGYAIAIVPAQIIQTRWRPSIFLPVCEIVWGVLTLVTYKAHNGQTVFALRFFLGIFESTSWPGLVSLIFNWYTPSELGKRLAIFGVSSVAGSMFLGVLQAALYKNLNGVNGLEGWQWLFIVSGCITIAWGFLGLLLIPDSPATTRALWLTYRERNLARKRMEEHGTKTSHFINRRTLIQKLKATSRSPLVWLFLVAYLQFAWSQRANSYFLLYLKQLKNVHGGQLYSTYKVNLIPLGGYGLSIISNISLNALSDWKQWRWQVSIGAAALQVICCAVLASWPNSTSTIMAFYFLTFATAAWGYALIAWLAEILRKEPEARSISVAVAVTLVYIGHATIPLRAWRVADSPRYAIGFPLAAAFGVGSILAILGMQYYVLKHPELQEYGFRGGTEGEAEADGDGDVEVEMSSKEGKDSLAISKQEV